MLIYYTHTCIGGKYIENNIENYQPGKVLGIGWSIIENTAQTGKIIVVLIYMYILFTRQISVYAAEVFVVGVIIKVSLRC